VSPFARTRATSGSAATRSITGAAAARDHEDVGVADGLAGGGGSSRPIVARSTPGSAARRASMSRTSGSTSPSGVRPWCSRANANPRRIFSSLFSPNRGRARMRPSARRRLQALEVGDAERLVERARPLSARRPRPAVSGRRTSIGVRARSSSWYAMTPVVSKLRDFLRDALADAGNLRQRLHPAACEHRAASARRTSRSIARLSRSERGLNGHVLHLEEERDLPQRARDVGVGQRHGRHVQRVITRVTRDRFGVASSGATSVHQLGDVEVDHHLLLAVVAREPRQTKALRAQLACAPRRSSAGDGRTRRRRAATMRCDRLVEAAHGNRAFHVC